MRLIKTNSVTIEEFFPSDVPDYAILSHRWGKEEVSLQEFETVTGAIKSKEGYKKIANFCRRAKADGYEHVWVDTCCIDKTSSAELSESINSMYLWYYRASRCYAYLSDIVTKSNIHLSEWFMRGWTLQELIAPEDVYFVNKDWTDLGTKSTLQQVISTHTGIPQDILTGVAEVESASVAQRMSWAAKRKTTRLEDSAYCLMGLFGINMPLLYGEGEQAFLRLQQEIMRVSNDQSILAWTSSDTRGGALATSPAAFTGREDIIRLRHSRNRSNPFTLSSLGVQVEIPFIGVTAHGIGLVLLDCQRRHDKDNKRISIFVQDMDMTMTMFGRIRSNDLRVVDIGKYLPSQYPMTTVCLETRRMMPSRKLTTVTNADNAAQFSVLEEPTMKQNLAFPNRDALTKAAEAGRNDDVWLLLTRSHVDINMQDDDGRTALSRAAEAGNSSLTETLIYRKANLNLADRGMKTALHYAVENGHGSIVKLLASNGANLEAYSSRGGRPLSLAAEKNRVEIGRILLDYGATGTGYNHNNWTALNVATNNNHDSFVQMLLDSGAYLGLDDP